MGETGGPGGRDPCELYPLEASVSPPAQWELEAIPDGEGERAQELPPSVPGEEGDGQGRAKVLASTWSSAALTQHHLPWQIFAAPTQAGGCWLLPVPPQLQTAGGHTSWPLGSWGCV